MYLCLSVYVCLCIFRSISIFVFIFVCKYIHNIHIVIAFAFKTSHGLRRRATGCLLRPQRPLAERARLNCRAAPCSETWRRQKRLALLSAACCSLPVRVSGRVFIGTSEAHMQEEQRAETESAAAAMLRNMPPRDAKRRLQAAPSLTNAAEAAACPCAAARRNHLMASALSCATPRPFSNMRPKLN